MSEERKRVVVSAYYCDPHRGSEWAMSWSWVSQMAKYYDVFVVTSETSRDSRRRFEFPEGISMPKFIYIKNPIPWVLLGKSSSFAIMLLNYLLWQLKAMWVVRKLHRVYHFQLVHHLSWASLVMHGFLWLLKIPFLIGPVGGGQRTPKGFYRELGRFSVVEWFRTLSIRTQCFNPLIRIALRKTKIVLVANAETHKLAALLGARCIRQMPMVGVAMHDKIGVSRIPSKQPVILFAGRLHPTKGVLLALRAFTRVVRSGYNARLRIIGDGPLRKLCETRILRDGLGRFVDVIGWITREQMEREYFSSDIFLFPSLRDSYPNVVLEALSHGLPVVTLDHQAMRDLVTEECGIKVRVDSPEQTAGDLAMALSKLLDDPGLREAMGACARRWVLEQYSWERLGIQMRSYYEEVLKGTDAEVK